MDASAPAIPPSLRAMMSELGPRWGSNIREFTNRQSAAFSELLARAPKQGRMVRDLPYGPDPRQVLDVFSPPSPPSDGRGAPVVLFMHGGAFVVGDKDRTPEIYANVCWYLARNGVVGINMEYRLAPANKYPSGVEDVALAVQWAKANARAHGGDPSRIYLMGHSAGGAHVGCYAYDRSFHPPGGPGISGLVLVSSRVRIDVRPDNPNANNVRAYFGTDPAAMERGSVVNHVSADSVPTLVAIAHWENPLLDIYGLELAHLLAEAKGRAPRTVWLAGHNHNSSIAHMNTADDDLGRAILQFIEEGH